MKLTAKRKLQLGILLLAVVAFVVDRCYFSPPAANARHPAALSLAPPAPVAKGIASGVTHDPADELIDFTGVSARLQKATAAEPANTTSPRDAFQPPAAWVARAAAKTQRAMPSPVERFRSHHRLLAVLTGDRVAWAIIDGKTLGIGQTIDGFRLVAVGDGSAIFESAGERVELQLPK